MDFDQLPSEIFSKILRHLSLQGQFRASGVNQRFREISSTIIAERKSLDLVNQLAAEHRLGHASLSRIFELCAPGLERVVVDARWQLEIFCHYTCPKLIEFISNAKTTNNIVDDVIRNNRNLQIFRMPNPLFYIGTHPRFIFPIGTTSEKLETLEIQWANTNTFQSLTGRLPNLKQFAVMNIEDPYKFRPAIFDDFCLNCPKLERLVISTDGRFGHFVASFIRLPSLINFWRLSSLEKLVLNSADLGDGCLEKISSSFPKLVVLHLHIHRATNVGVSSLAALENLQSLTLGPRQRTDPSIDAGLQHLSKCKRLQSIEFEFGMVSATVRKLVRLCRELRQLKIYTIGDIDNEADATTLVQSFGGFVNQNISIIFYNCYRFEPIWQSIEVESALNELDESGQVITITDGKRRFFD